MRVIINERKPWSEEANEWVSFMDLTY